MAEKMAMKMGKSFLNKKMGKQDKKNRETAFSYQDIDKRGRTVMKKKDIEYYKSLGIPDKDAVIIAKVKTRARYLDGSHNIPLTHIKFGLSSVIGLLPAFGDAIDGLLAMSVIKTASSVSGGLDDGIRNKMVLNLVLDVLIGLTPILGDFADTLFRCNTRNAALLEQMLIKRVKETHHAARDAEKIAGLQSRGHTYTNGYYDSEPVSDLPPRYDERHAGVHKRLQAKAPQDSAKTTQASRGGGGWLNILASRGQNAAAAEVSASAGSPRPVNDARGYTAMEEDVAPARPPRPGTTRHHQVGSF